MSLVRRKGCVLLVNTLAPGSRVSGPGWTWPAGWMESQGPEGQEACLVGVAAFSGFYVCVHLFHTVRAVDLVKDLKI